MAADAVEADTSSVSGHFAGCVGDSSACSTPFVSAPSSPARDPSFHIAPPAAGCYFSAPASPARGAGGEELDFDSGFGFDFSSRFPSPAAAAMSSADELFHNGQIRPMRLSSFLLRPQQPLPPPTGDLTEPAAAQPGNEERGRIGQSRSVHRRARSLSPFRGPRKISPARAPAKDKSPTSASRSSSSSSTASSASSASSSSSGSHRRWRFLKDLVHRNYKSDDGPPVPSLPPMPTAPKTKNTSPADAETRRGRRRRSAHERLYEVRRAEAEDMRRRTFLPYRQGLLLGCLGLGSRGYGAMHGLAAAATATARSRS